MDKSTIEDRTRKLHALAVKWHTILKDLRDVQEHIQHLQSFSVTIPCQGYDSMANDHVPSSDALRLIESSCLFWSRWVTTYLERTNIRINLVSLPNYNFLAFLVLTSPDA